VPYCQKYTPQTVFFGDFAHWVCVAIGRSNFKGCEMRINLSIKTFNINVFFIRKCLYKKCSTEILRYETIVIYLEEGGTLLIFS